MDTPSTKDSDKAAAIIAEVGPPLARRGVVGSPVVKDVIGYASPRGRRGGRVLAMAGLFVVAQVLWYFPAVFATWYVLCNTGRIQTLVGEFAGACVVCAPSFGAVWCGARVALERDSAPDRRALAASAALAGLALIGFVFVSAVRVVLHPSPYPCL
jgi:hypothetical protein